MFQKFGKLVPVLDQATGKARTNADRATLMATFQPYALRKQQNPAAASAITNEDHRVTAKLDEAETIFQEYKIQMSMKLKEIAGLEIIIRKEKLATDFLKHC
jgi:hypothetical protein